MNGPHLRAFIWLRWRLRLNELRRGGLANFVLLLFLGVLGGLFALSLFVLSLLAGLFLLREAAPGVLMLVWDGLILAFLFAWTVRLVNDLQRSEPLSLAKFLHLPVSLTSAFLINYIASLINFSVILFFPAMLGLSLALTLSRGPAMMLLLPLLLSFLFMITALTYQFQGWLASLMVNPRRRRVVIVVVSACFFLIVQAPNLLNLLQPWRESTPGESASRFAKEESALKQAVDAEEISTDEYARKREELAARKKREQEERDQRALEQVEEVAAVANLLLPPGWLALGARELAAGRPWGALAATAGLGLIGAASLRRAYRTSLRIYTGQFTSGATSRPAADAAPRTAPGARPSTPANPLERRLPGLSEAATALALGSFHSLVRAPEAKMMLLSPILMIVIFGGMFLSRTREVADMARPLLPFGAMAMTLFSMVQLVGNQFGFDRGGFRIYVLAPVPRRDILLGKNLAVAVLALTLGLLTALVVHVLHPLRIDHLLAVPFQFVSMYVVFALLANCLSILAPMRIAPGSFRPTGAKALPILLHLALFLVFPLVLAPLLLPLAVEVLAAGRGWAGTLPLHLLLTVLETALLVWLYRVVLRWQGAWLQAREQRILDIVTARAE